VANPLLDRIVRAIPERFFSQLKSRQLPIYKQSIAMSFAEPWGRAEAFSVLPGNRRGLWECEMRQAAITSKIQHSDTPHSADNSSCVTARVDRLILTGHFVDGPDQLPREAVSRKQNAAVNRFQPYHINENLLTAPLPKFGKAPIYINILHGARFPYLKSDSLEIDVTTCFLRVAVPSHDSNSFLLNWSIEEVLAHYAATRTQEPPQGLVDRARPQRKKGGPNDDRKKTGNEGR
jgi:hypothetical protein